MNGASLLRTVKKGHNRGECCYEKCQETFLASKSPAEEAQ